MRKKDDLAVLARFPMSLADREECAGSTPWVRRPTVLSYHHDYATCFAYWSLL